MKTKRNNVSNRRNMVGGFNFDIDMEQVKKHIFRKCSKLLSITDDSQLTLTLMGYGVVYISKNSLLAEDLSFEQVVAVRCVIQTSGAEREYYAIVRCATYKNPRSCLDGKGISGTVLFVEKDKVTKMNFQGQLENPVINKIKNYSISGTVSEFFTKHEWFNFKNSISSTAEYNIFIDKTPSSSTLIKFFEFLSSASVSMAAYQPDITFETMKAQIDEQERIYNATREAREAQEAQDNARPKAQSNNASGAASLLVGIGNLNF